MTSPLYGIRNDAEFKGGTVTFANGDTYPFASDHPKYKEIVKALIGGEDEKTIFSLVAPFESIFLGLVNLSSRVSRKGMQLYFDGDVLNSAIAKQIITSLDAEGFVKGKTWRAYVAFLERLMTNPSAESRDHFYKYVESHGLTITPEGLVLLYKGVMANPDKTVGGWTSKNAGPGIVTDEKGVTTEYKSAFLPNGVGYTVSIPRALVDTNRQQHCSVGLHAGTYQYAKDFGRGGALLTVLVDPRDVVSVPSDYNNAKVRLSKYSVLEINTKDTAYATGIHKTPAPAKAATPAPAKPSEAKPVGVSTPAQAAPTATGDAAKIADFESTIKALVKADPKVKLSSYKNKRITVGQRANFAQAASNLGYQA